MDMIHTVVTSKSVDWFTSRNEGQRKRDKAFTTAISVPVHHILQSYFYLRITRVGRL